MIYLRFHVRPAASYESFKAVEEIAEFMFDENDPRECTRRAVEVLRDEGLRAVSLSDAQEGFSASDFVGRNTMRDLFESASENGVAYSIFAPDLAEPAR